MDLYLRKVRHPQAPNNYRVLVKFDGEELEVGSIGLQNFTSDDTAWTWGIDTVIPLRAFETQGRGADRRDCMAKFRTAWEKLSADSGLLAEFMVAKRRARRR
ncbi:hypothetical protein JJC00_18910 [Bradyrhizobium diazoefficiens]|uniref:hypothetical protein n=1 Tax=Bradyrhizobium diazoefficiens TaxID=1355477 RepID=UPI00190B6FC9|nr:hypothetical protein [Bradyrhizobium diazoefficiens]QQO30756.1 hypothetical protein JJC00_18910 [Bradyrhizobium diazoefficiens]